VFNELGVAVLDKEEVVFYLGVIEFEIFELLLQCLLVSLGRPKLIDHFFYRVEVGFSRITKLDDRVYYFSILRCEFRLKFVLLPVLLTEQTILVRFRSVFDFNGVDDLLLAVELSLLVLKRG